MNSTRSIIKCIFYSEFDVIVGPKITYQVNLKL